MVLVHEDGHVLLPLRAIAASAGLRVTATDDADRFTVTLAYEREAVIDLERRELRVPGGERPLDAEQAVVYADELFLAPALLEAVLDDAVVTLDFSLLLARITRTQPFPVQQQLAIERRRMAVRREGGGRGEQVDVPYPPRTGGAVLDWSLYVPQLREPESAQLRLNFGAAVLGGAVVAGRAFAPGLPGGSSDSWHYGYYRVFPNGRLVRQLQIGEAIAGGIRARGIRGVLISNAERYQAPDFSSIELTPRLPPGWEYEVYDAGRLIAYSDPAQEAPVLVPLRYGRTSVEVRMYGPAGEEVREEYHYQVPAVQLRPGRFEYIAGAGRCQSGRECTAYGLLDTRAGISRAVTVGAGTEWLTDSAGAARFNPRMEASVSALAGLLAMVQHEPGRASRGRLSYSGPGPIWLAVAGGRSRFTNTGGVISPVSLGRRELEVNAGLRGGPGLFRAMRMRLRFEAPLEAAVDRVQFAAARDFRRGTSELTYERFRGTPDIVMLRGGYAPSAPWFGKRGQTIFGRLAADSEGVREADVSLSVPLPRNIALSGGIRWQVRAGTGSVDLSGSMPLSFARASLRSRLGSGPSLFALAADGSLTANGLQPPRARTLASTGTAGVHGRVFYDHDGDGVFGPGDEPAVDVVVLAGPVAARTRDDGTYSAFGVGSWDPLAVRLDTLRIPDPGWSPVQRERLLRPTPNTSVRVDFPLAAGREVYGQITGGEGIRTVGGVRVLLTNDATGEQITVLTFSDGEFYLSRVPTGSYTLTIAEAALEVLGARPEPELLSVVVPPGSGAPVSVPPVLLRSIR